VAERPRGVVRPSGVRDAIVVLVAVVALACVSYFGFDDDETLHIAAGTALLAVLALKIAVIRRWHALGRFLPSSGSRPSSCSRSRGSPRPDRSWRGSEMDERRAHTRQVAASLLVALAIVVVVIVVVTAQLGPSGGREGRDDDGGKGRQEHRDGSR
jgi:small-conductance mechanosensitive channel